MANSRTLSFGCMNTFSLNVRGVYLFSGIQTSLCCLQVERQCVPSFVTDK